MAGKQSIIWVCGGTDYAKPGTISKALSRYPAGSVVVTGQANGADSFADAAARELGMFVIRIPYAGHLGRSGGPARNTLICRVVRLLAEDASTRPVCLAFGGDRGTAHSLKLATKHNFKIRRYK
jgi:hypothetical protein